jgi:hypothetical protein
MTTISVEPILRSRHAQRPDIVMNTFVMTYPRPIHSEFMTHHDISKNSSSSRAVPHKKTVEALKIDPFIPSVWTGLNSGMIGAEDPKTNVDMGEFMNFGHSFPVAREDAVILAMNKMIEFANALNQAGYSKQISNRYLEPWMHMKVVASGTNWKNLLWLRDHVAAEPHFQILAQKIKEQCEREDNIQVLEPGMWHLPWITKEDREQAWSKTNSSMKHEDREHAAFGLLSNKSVAHCASVSYKTVDGFDMTFEKALELSGKLQNSDRLHASPFEHVAQADEWISIPARAPLRSMEQVWANKEQHGNLRGFRQLRKMMPGEYIDG